MTMERTGFFRDVAAGPLSRRGAESICAAVEWSVVGGAKAMGSLPRADGLMPSWHKCKEYRQQALLKQSRLNGQNRQTIAKRQPTCACIAAARKLPEESLL